MPRLLLVARNPGLAFGLASASDDIIEVRPSLVGRLAVTPGMADVVVIEQEKPADALVTLDMIRAAGLMAPALLVASSRKEWASFETGDRLSVAVLAPPVTPERLDSSVGSTVSLPAADDRPVDPGPPAAEAAADPVEMLQAGGTPLGTSDDELPTGPVDLEPADEPYATAVHIEDTATESTAALETAIEDLPTDDGIPAVEMTAHEAEPVTPVLKGKAARASKAKAAPAPEAEVHDGDLALETTRTEEPAPEAATVSDEPAPEAPVTHDETALIESAEPHDEPAPESAAAQDEEAGSGTAPTDDEPLPEPTHDEKALGGTTRADGEDETEATTDDAVVLDEEPTTETTPTDDEPLPEPTHDEKALADTTRADDEATTHDAVANDAVAVLDEEPTTEPAPTDDKPLPEPTHDEKALADTTRADDEATTDDAVAVQAEVVAEPTPFEDVQTRPEPAAPAPAEAPAPRDTTDVPAAANGFSSVAAAASVLNPSGSWFDSFPRAALYDDESALAPETASPSPAAWTPAATEPVLAWTSAPEPPTGMAAPAVEIVAPLRPAPADPEPLSVYDSITVPTQPTSQAPYPAPADASVYASMASLMAASEERLADERQQSAETEDLPDHLSPDDEVVEDVDLAALFSVGAGLTPSPRLPLSIVDVRDPAPEIDPRSAPVLIRALLARSHEVYGVTEAGQYVVSDALARTGATAGALLLPDGDTWRVAAGEGLRRLEHRYVLTEDSWLVTTIAGRHKGVIVDRTDVARRPLAGAPLAAHKHLVAAPVRPVSGILLIARDEDPAFIEQDLITLAELADSSAAVLAAALDARQLARALADITDQDSRIATERIDYGL